MAGIIHQIQLKYWQFAPNPQLKQLYAVRVLHDLIQSLCFFFLPIFLYQYGAAIPELYGFGLTALQRGIIFVAAFYATARLLMFFVAIPMAQFASRVGLTKAVLFAHFLRLIVFVSLLLSDRHVGFIGLAVVMEALHTVLFWPSYLTLFTQHAAYREMGRDLGLLQFLIQLASVLAPAASGYFVAQFGFSVLFLVAVALTLTASTILLLIELESIPDTVNWKEFRQWGHERSFIALAAAFGGKYINDAALFLWPLYVFLLVGAVDRVGYLYTASLFLALLLVFFLGLYADHAKPSKGFFASGLVLGALWLSRINLFTVWGIALVDAAERLVSGGYWLFYDVIMVRRAKGVEAFSYFVYREVVVSVVAVLFWFFVAASFYFGLGWNGLFVIAAVGVVVSLLLKEHHLKA